MKPVERIVTVFVALLFVWLDALFLYCIFPKQYAYGVKILMELFR